MDDATNEHDSMFFCDQEGTPSRLRGVREAIERQGLFCSLYTDRRSHYRHCCHDIKRSVKVLRHADGTLLLLTGNDPHQSRAIASRMGKGEQRRIRSRRAALADIAVEAGF